MGSGFRAGDLLVRVTPIGIEQRVNSKKLGIQVPEAGIVYTVRTLRVYEGVECVLLNEINNPLILTKVDGPVEPGWLVEHFKPARGSTLRAVARLKIRVGAGEKVQ